MMDEVTQKLKKDEWNKFLKKLDMTEVDYDKYLRYKDAVKNEIRELRVILESLEAKEKERVWLKNKTEGDIDDNKLIDGITGERSIYRRRAEADPNSFFNIKKPKRMHFLFDCSMSMSRYSGDGRVQRSLEAAVMVMEATKSFENKFNIKFSGHSGDTDNLSLFEFGKMPKNDKERLLVIKQIHSHIEVCDSGDNTMNALKKSILEITREDADDYFVFLISDANLSQYGITSKMVQNLINTDSRVHVYVIFIASTGGGTEIKEFKKDMPNNIFPVLDKKELPKTLKSMFLNAALEN